MIWSVTGFVVEVPSGAWADTYDRRRLLVVASLVSALGFALWTVWPSYAGFAAGFAMWGVSGAMVSGTFESLIYDELSSCGATTAYPRFSAAARAAETTAAMIGILLGAPLYAVADTPSPVGSVSGSPPLRRCSRRVHQSRYSALPEPTPGGSPSHAGEIEQVDGRSTYLTVLSEGIREATRHPLARRAVLITAVLYGLTTYDEYLPLVASESGASTAVVPLLLGAVTIGELVGVGLAGRTVHLSGRRIGVIVAAGGVLLAAGALSGHPAGFAILAVAFGLAHNTVIVSEARLQDSITGRARATVTSVVGLATEVVVLAVYAGVAIGSPWLSVSVLVALCAVPTFGAAWATARWLPARDPHPARSGAAKQRRSFLRPPARAWRGRRSETFRRGETEHADLALGLVAVHGQRGLAGVVERVDLAEQRLDLAFADQLVGGVRLR